jgi:hypothetical protein
VRPAADLACELLELSSDEDLVFEDEDLAILVGGHG